MKNLASILFFCCLSILLFGYHFVFHIQLHEIKAEMKAFLKAQHQHKDVIEFHFNNNDIAILDWEEEGEFRFHAQMYDVIEKKKEGDSVVIRCIADKNETALIGEFQKQDERSRSSASILQWITTAFILPGSYEFIQPQKTIDKHFVDLTPALAMQASTIFIPPPEV